jgi:hypothetical protein
MKRTMIGLAAVAFAGGLVALTQLTGWAGDDEVKLVVPAADAGNLMKDDIKIANDALKGKDGKVLPKDIKRAKVAALSVALIAKASKKDDFYAQAVKALETLKILSEVDKENEKDFAAALASAQKATSELSSPKGGDSKGDAIKLALWDAENKDWDRDLAMQLFKTPRAGGLGYEKTIKDLAEKKAALTAKEMETMGKIATETAMLVQAVEQIGSTKAGGPGATPEAWKKFAQDLQKSAIETAGAVAKKDQAAVKAAINKMDTSCVNCHDKFKKTS